MMVEEIIPDEEILEEADKENMMISLRMIGLAVVLGCCMMTGCSSDADVASYNLSKAADQFEVNRRVVFYNGITSEYILSVEGRCSIKDQGNQLELTCKTSASSYKKHFLGLSDNVTYFAEQLEGTAVSAYRYRVIFKPESIVPDVDLVTSHE
jgi:hypothetical protein